MLSLDQILDGLAVEARPFAICEARGDAVIDMDARDQATLHYVLAGAGRFVNAGLPAIDIRTGTIVVTPARVKHGLRALPSDQCEQLNCAPLSSKWQLLRAGEGNNGVIVACSEISVSYRGIDGLFNYLQAPLICRLEGNDTLRATLEQVLHELASPKAGSHALVRALMQQCMIHILRQTSTSTPSPVQWLTAAHDERLWRAVTAIFDEPQSAHTLESLSQVAQMSRSAFADHFKQAFGRGPIELLKHVRLQRAARLLATSSLSIKTITRDVGYSSRSYFSRAFHDCFGRSPAAYRAAYVRDGDLGGQSAVN